MPFKAPNKQDKKYHEDQLYETINIVEGLPFKSNQISTKVYFKIFFFFQKQVKSSFFLLLLILIKIT